MIQEYKQKKEEEQKSIINLGNSLRIYKENNLKIISKLSSNFWMIKSKNYSKNSMT